MDKRNSTGVRASHGTSSRILRGQGGKEAQARERPPAPGAKSAAIVIYEAAR